MKAVASCLEDRNADVRQAAQALLTTLIGVVGSDKLTRACSGLDGSAKQQVRSFFSLSAILQLVYLIITVSLSLIEDIFLKKRNFENTGARVYREELDSFQWRWWCRWKAIHSACISR